MKLVSNIKRTLAIRWLRYINTGYLATYAEDRRIKDVMNKSYKGLCEKMVDMYFAEVKK